MIEAKNLSFTYRCGRNVLNDVSFDLGAGHCIDMLGKPGEGQRTLLKCLKRILSHDEGIVTVSGPNI